MEHHLSETRLWKHSTTPVAKGQITYHVEGCFLCVRKFASPGRKWVLSRHIHSIFTATEQFACSIIAAFSFYFLLSFCDFPESAFCF